MPTEGAIRVFLSYTRADRARVEPVVALLRGAGFDLWWDSDLKTGAAFTRETEAALEAADVVVVAWSAASVQSDWVKDEAGHGRDRGRLLPLRLEDVQAPLGFRQLQWVDLIGWNGRPDAAAAQRLVAAVAEVAGQPAPVRGPAGPARSTRINRRLLLAGGGLAALGLGGIATLRLVPGLGCRIGLGGCAVEPGRQSVAVLPFANLSAAADQQFFADGLTEELQTRLGRFPGLAVAGRTSSFRFRDRRQSTADMAAALGVGYLVDGSVRRAGDRVRVTAELIDASTGLQRWGETYERQLKDIFAVQSDIAEAVARSLRGALLGDKVDTNLGGTTDPAAWEELLLGRAMISSAVGAAGARQALVHLDAAVAADPRFARARAARARALVNLANQYLPVGERPATYAQALSDANAAVRLVPQLPEAQTTLALVLTDGQRDFAGAGQAFARALAAGPPDSGTQYRYGVYLMRVGQLAAGVQRLQEAVKIDPLDASKLRTLSAGLLRAGRFAEAIAAARRAVAVTPGTSGAEAQIGKALYLQGQLRAALAAYRREPETWERLTGEAIVLHRLGDRPAAAAALAELIRVEGDAIWYQRAQITAQWGDLAAAQRALDRAFATNDSGLVDILFDPFMDPLVSTPGFKKIVSALGLVVPSVPGNAAGIPPSGHSGVS